VTTLCAPSAPVHKLLLHRLKRNPWQHSGKAVKDAIIDLGNGVVDRPVAEGILVDVGASKEGK